MGGWRRSRLLLRRLVRCWRLGLLKIVLLLLVTLREKLELLLHLLPELGSGCLHPCLDKSGTSSGKSHGSFLQCEREGGEEGISFPIAGTRPLLSIAAFTLSLLPLQQRGPSLRPGRGSFFPWGGASICLGISLRTDRRYHDLDDAQQWDGSSVRGGGGETSGTHVGVLVSNVLGSYRGKSEGPASYTGPVRPASDTQRSLPVYLPSPPLGHYCIERESRWTKPR